MQVQPGELDWKLGRQANERDAHNGFSNQQANPQYDQSTEDHCVLRPHFCPGGHRIGNVKSEKNEVD